MMNLMNLNAIGLDMINEINVRYDLMTWCDQILFSVCDPVLFNMITSGDVSFDWI